MEIPYTELSADALQAIIEEFISREGTDYGDQDYSLQDKVEQVRAQLRQGVVGITYDSESQTCHLIDRRQAVVREADSEKDGGANS